MNELFHSLGIDWKLMVAQLVNFAILLFILGRFVYAPVMRLIDGRREIAAETLEREKKSREKLAAIEGERKQILQEARRESQRIIDEARAGGEALGRTLVAEAQAAIERMRADAERRLAGERAKLAAEVRREIGALVAEAVTRSFGDVFDARTQGRMVEQALAVLREDARARGSS